MDLPTSTDQAGVAASAIAASLRTTYSAASSVASAYFASPSLAASTTSPLLLLTFQSIKEAWQYVGLLLLSTWGLLAP